MSPPVTVIVPLDVDNDATGERLRNWRWLEGRYRSLFAGWLGVVRADPGEGAFSKARAVNEAVRLSPAEGTLVIVDADVLIATDSLYEAVAHAESDPHGRWVVPFGEVYRLSQAATERALEADRTDPGAPHPIPPGPDIDPERPHYRGKAGGGAVVLGRAAFDRVGGMDERFEGWGGEDYAFAHALRACIDAPVRLETPLWHLWHPPAPEYDAAGKLPEANRRLLARYRRSARDADTMRELLDDRGGNHVGCGCGGGTPADPGAPLPSIATCLTCLDAEFANYTEAQAHKDETGHVIEGLRGLRAKARREATVDPFAGAVRE